MAITLEEIRQAVARGWCVGPNASKTMDSELALAIAGQVAAALSDRDSQWKAACDEWINKSDWVQEQMLSFPPSALGKHRADVMREEIERLRAFRDVLMPHLPLLKDALSEYLARSHDIDEIKRAKDAFAAVVKACQVKP